MAVMSTIQQSFQIPGIAGVVTAIDANSAIGIAHGASFMVFDYPLVYDYRFSESDGDGQWRALVANEYFAPGDDPCQLVQVSSRLPRHLVRRRESLECVALLLSSNE